MEILIGSLLTLTIIITNNLVLRNPVKKVMNTKIRFSQSNTQVLMSDLLNYENEMLHEETQRQSKKFIQQSYIRVVIVEDNAYWIKDNALYVADIVDGMVDRESSKRVDTINMDSVELEKTMTIVEKLREGLDEDSGTGK